jgi:hypothetical protein
MRGTGKGPCGEHGFPCEAQRSHSVERSGSDREGSVATTIAIAIAVAVAVAVVQCQKPIAFELQVTKRQSQSYHRNASHISTSRHLGTVSTTV